MQKGLTGKNTLRTLALAITLACVTPLLSAAEIKGTLKPGELSIGSDLTNPHRLRHHNQPLHAAITHAQRLAGFALPLDHR